MDEPIKRSLEYIFEGYLQAKHEPMKNHKVASYLSHQIRENFMLSGIIDSYKYVVTGSAGKGNWAEIPWIGIFDKEISTTATKGYDIVYLFTADMQGVYLSLNQGWTYFKDIYKTAIGKQKIKRVATAWQYKLASNLNDFPVNEIDLRAVNAHSDLASGYELGHICGKFYKADDLPDEFILKNDLQNMLALLRELKGHMINNSIEDTNNDLLVHFDDISSNKLLRKNSAINWIIENKAQSCTLYVSEPPKEIERILNSGNMKQRADYDTKNKRDRDIGLAGELIAIEYERSLNPEKNRIEHVSIIEGDSKGYDIKSYDEHGEIKYIEVKTTTGAITTPFYISANEVNFSKQNSDHYFLYRIYNFNPGAKTASLYILNGDITKNCELRAESFITQSFIR